MLTYILKRILGFIPALWADKSDYVLVDDARNAIHSNGCKSYLRNVKYIDWNDLHKIDKHLIGVICGSYRRLAKESNDIDLLIVMGGPQCPNTTKDECPHFEETIGRELV